ELRKSPIFAREHVCELARVSGPPGGEQIVRVALGVVHLIDRELEEPALFARREMLELPELLIECLEAAHLLAGALTLTDPEYLKLGYDPDQGAERQIERRAQHDGKEMGGLETLDEESVSAT